MGHHKEWRKLVKKIRRKRIRQHNAIKRDELQKEEERKRQNSPTYIAWLQEQQRIEEFQKEEEAKITAKNEAEWLKREEIAQKQWQELQEKLKLAWAERTKQRAKIKEEWEREQKRLKKKKEKEEQKAQERLKKQEELKEKIDNFIVNGGDEPEELSVNLETQPGKEICPFFQKVGACRFGDACSRNHIRPGISRVLLIPNFYSHYSLATTETEYGNDIELEFDTREIYRHFKDFFFDVLPEMEKCGRIRQFKVCCNKEPHLRGNVYVEYKSRREAIKSYKMFQGRWYGGKRLNVEFCNIKSWKFAICGLFFKNKCPKGSACNFLHVFRNPGNLFSEADRDKRSTPPAFEDLESSTPDTRHWRWSESPEHIISHDYENDTKHHKKSSHPKKIRSRSRSKNRSSRNSDRSRSRSKTTRRESSRSEHSEYLNSHIKYTGIKHRHKVRYDDKSPSYTSSRHSRSRS